MQQRALLLLALVAAPAAASSVKVFSTAQAWLKSHQMPNQDQLAALAGSNPEAYAIVNALLSKHSHGAAKLSADEKGPDVFRRMMGTPHLAAAATATRVEVPYASNEIAEVSTQTTVDQAHYDPSTAANRDESSVSRLLNAVASMGGNKGKKIAALMKKRHVKTQEENPLEADAGMFAEETPTIAPEQAMEEAVAPVPAKPQKKVNSWLKGLDLSGDMPVRMSEQAHEERPVAVAQTATDDSADSSGDLSWQAALSQQVEKPKAAPVTEAPKPKKDNSVFLKWLGVVDKAPAPTVQPKPSKKTNSYLDSVKFFG